jgi:hypothetical protein
VARNEGGLGPAMVRRVWTGPVLLLGAVPKQQLLLLLLLLLLLWNQQPPMRVAVKVFRRAGDAVALGCLVVVRGK